MGSAFAARMLAAFLVLYFAWAALAQGPVHRYLLERLTVAPAATLVNAMQPAEAVASRGDALLSPRARLVVREGCEGFEVMLLLGAAFAAAPLGWRRRLLGLAAGLALVYALNQARIVSLWFALRHDRELFALLHGVVAPALLVGAACAYFAWCLPRIARA
jgi:exosortase family protein XrtM